MSALLKAAMARDELSEEQLLDLISRLGHDSEPGGDELSRQVLADFERRLREELVRSRFDEKVRQPA